MLALFRGFMNTWPARLLILGDGEQREALQALAADCGGAEDVALPGFESNPFAAMRTASVLVTPTRRANAPRVRPGCSATASSTESARSTAWMV